MNLQRQTIMHQNNIPLLSSHNNLPKENNLTKIKIKEVSNKKYLRILLTTY
jgi:hypothetical protein